MPTQQQQKAIRFAMGISKILRQHSLILCNNNNFYLNISEWFASPGGAKFSKLIGEMSKEELNVFLKSFSTSARKIDGTSVNKSSTMKSILEQPLIVSFALHL